MRKLEPTPASFGGRHPVLVTVLLVSGLGFVSGTFIGPTDNVLLNGLIGGVGGAAFFLLLTAIPAFVWTAVQSIRHAFRQRSYGDGDAESCPEPFRRRFVKNLDATMDFVAQGWTP